MSWLNLDQFVGLVRQLVAISSGQLLAYHDHHTKLIAPSPVFQDLLGKHMFRQNYYYMAKKTCLALSRSWNP